MALSGESILPEPTLDASALSPMMKLTERRSADGNGDFSSACGNNKQITNNTKKKHIGDLLQKWIAVKAVME
jgi:hypothetical protein